MSELNELLKQLSEAVPELGLSWMQSNFLYCDPETDGEWAIGTNGVMCPVELNIGRVVLIAAIRDWIVAQYGQVIVYDTLVLTRKFSWKVYDIVAEQFVYESDAHEDELEVAIECALAVKEKKE